MFEKLRGIEAKQSKKGALHRLLQNTLCDVTIRSLLSFFKESSLPKSCDRDMAHYSNIVLQVMSVKRHVDPDTPDLTRG